MKINEIDGLVYVASRWIGHIALMKDNDLHTLFLRLRDLAVSEPNAIDRAALQKFADIVYDYWKDGGEN